MTRYISKDALVAEIEKLISNGQVKLQESQESNDCESYVAWAEHIATCIKVLSLIDTLEVKEVQENFASEDLEEAIDQSFIYHENHGDDFRSDKQIEAAYRYGFKTGVKYKELASLITKNIEKQNLETKELDLDKKIKDYFDNQPIITRSKGVDYKLIPTGVDIAKHFFELGLKSKEK